MEPADRPQNRAAGPSSPARRSLMKAAGTAAAAAVGVTRNAGAQVVPVRSPFTTPWLQPLPVQAPLKPLDKLSPEPLLDVDRAGEECGRATHPAFKDFAPKDFYEITAARGQHEFHPELPRQDVYGYNGQVPGPLFHARYGRPVLVRLRNNLPNLRRGYGSPDVSMHLHNMHTPSESDGYPVDWWSAFAYAGTLTRAGRFKDHHYPMIYAGNDEREALGTLWYHDHREDFTAGNVYGGMAGFFLAFDEIDSGDENDGDNDALRLPSGEFDVPLMIGDKQFDSSGYLVFNQFDNDGFIGDKFLVNGKIQPFFHVAPRKYRFRLLVASTSRVFDLQLRYQDKVQTLTQISADGNVFTAPILRPNVQLGAAERADIVVDFSKFPVGAEVFLTNRLAHLDGRKPEKEFLRTPVQLLKFIVDKPLRSPDNSRVLDALRKQPDIDLGEVKKTRTFSFARDGGAWTVNGKLFEDKRGVVVEKGTAEIWNLRNDSGGWAHPVHIHFEEGRVLKRNGGTPPPWERGRKDVYFLGPNESVSVFLRFRDFTGRYVMHCHNTIHEDHGMMIRYDIED
ncbi:MAG TPA: multicopper oxidase domain-containing protein [Ramlibacter sp.]|uniref:multicopper oxidase family protein n=1 Tax=Ramlibacter sp. TaxID=1917967 RepID=UPI002ED54E85